MEMGVASALVLATLVIGAASEYNEVTARRALNYASAAYCQDHSLLQHWRCSACQELPDFQIDSIITDNDVSTNALAYIGIQPSPPTIIVAFRGTIFSSPGAVIDDLHFIQTAYPAHIPGATVHSGFLSYFQSVNVTLHERLGALISQHTEHDVLFTGHSLGGGVAVLAIYDYRLLFAKASIYTFGTPRVGNSIWSMEFSGRFRDRSFRVVHWRDILVRVPMCNWNILGTVCAAKEDRYPYHTVQEVFYNEDMSSYVLCSEEDGEDRTCSDQFSMVDGSIYDHKWYFGRHVGENSAAGWALNDAATMNE